MSAGRLSALLLAAALLVVAYWLVTRKPEPAQPPPPPGPPAEVLARLARGVNLSNWMQHGRDADTRRYAPDEGDWTLIRGLDLGHVRILVDPEVFMGERGLPRPEALAQLHAVTQKANAEGLAVVIALQLPAEYKQRLADSDADRQALAGAWRALASALRDIPPRDLLLEPLNETEADHPVVSRGLLAGLVRNLRSVLPQHTLVAAGHRWSAVEDLEALTPLDDPNVVYDFHFYEPHNFTHQGATWGPKAWKRLRRVPYPSSPERVAPLLGTVSGDLAELLKWHGEQRWNRQKIDGLIGRAAAWGRSHGVPVWCGEFGVLKKNAAPADRLAWLRDVRESLESHGIPWTHWDYAGDFGLVTGNRGRRKVDRATAEALGLEPPAP